MEKTEKRDTEKWKHREKKEDTQNKRDTKHTKKAHFETTENSHLRRQFEITVKNTVLRSASL